MGNIICIANLKGGTGKTTTAVHLAAALSVMEKRTLVVDCDPLGNLTIAFGLDKNSIENDLYRSLTGEADFSDVIFETEFDFLHIIPSRFEALNSETRLLKSPNGETALRKQLEKIKNDYDFIILDPPPSAGFLTKMSLIAADRLIVPLQFQIFSMEGLARMLPLVQRIRKTVNPGLKIAGILLTVTGANGNLIKDQAAGAAENIRKSIFKTTIPFDDIVLECSEIGIPAIFKDIDADLSKAYLDFAAEISAYFEK